MSESFIGQISLFANTFAPRNWAYCNGQLIAIAQNGALFSILGTTYGGDGRTTFGVPELRGRVVLHAGTGKGLSRRKLGEKGGVNSVALTSLQMPSHTHEVTDTASATMHATTDPGTSTSPAGNVPATAGVVTRGGGETTANIYAAPSAIDAALAPSPVTGDVTVGNSGGGQAHDNMQPFQGISYAICLFGLFPSRN